MKKSFLLLLVLGLVLVGCKDPKDNPEDPDGPKVNPKWVSTEITKKNALLEEFTGQGCGYCPDGHRRANLIEKANPGRFFPVNIHAGGYARPEMTCADATAIHDGFVVRGYPMGMVNRNDAGVVDRGAWSAYSNQEFQKDACVNMAAKGTLNKSTREFKVTVEMYYTIDAPAANNFLTVYLLEDSIWAAQSNGQKYNPDYWDDTRNAYCHMHVLRGTATDPWGVEITDTKKGSLVTKEITYTVPEKCGTQNIDLNHVHLIAVVCQEKKYNVLNVCKVDMQ